MLRFHNYDIVFQEVPDEVTLAINISNCPNRCKGCHSPHLLEDKGEILDENALEKLLQKYGSAITCVCFMGGDNSPEEVLRLAKIVKKFDKKTAWYSGKQNFPNNFALSFFSYIKLGPYVEHLGGLDSPSTNQRFYRIENDRIIDITQRFCKN
jgi:anaerobic ribonucleoside-triphosphate reductase activating protein